MRCQCCGNDSVYEVTVVWTTGEPTIATCSFCQSLINAGLIRREIYDGEVRYRQWHQDWRAGDLLPPVVELDDSDGIVPGDRRQGLNLGRNT